MTGRTSWVDGARELAHRSPRFASVIAQVGPPRLRRLPTSPEGRFGSLVRAIVFQQLAGAAASTIHRRFLELFDADPTPADVLATPPARLRAAGLSAAKAASIVDLATRVAADEVRLARIGRLDDDAVIEHLVQVRGIGPWTAQMFLMFDLRRPDVWPVGDLGVRAGHARVHGLTEPMRPADLEAAGEELRPWRSVAAWYCWQAVDVLPPA